MNNPSPTPHQHPFQQAEEHYQLGQTLKSNGQSDEALTEFRRAVLADPTHAASHLEIGKLCKDRAKRDEMFKRYSYDAFRQAARLDLNNQVAHEQYILLSQQTGKFEGLLEEYKALSEKNPENELLKRCVKNIITITMAMIPERVNVSDAKASGALRKFVLVGSLFMLLFGLGLIFGPPLIGKKNAPIKKESLRQLLLVGFFLDAVGVGGLLLSSRMK